MDSELALLYWPELVWKMDVCKGIVGTPELSPSSALSSSLATEGMSDAKLLIFLKNKGK